MKACDWKGRIQITKFELTGQWHLGLGVKNAIQLGFVHKTTLMLFDWRSCVWWSVVIRHTSQKMVKDAICGEKVTHSRLYLYCFCGIVLENWYLMAWFSWRPVIGSKMELLLCVSNA